MKVSKTLTVQEEGEEEREEGEEEREEGEEEREEGEEEREEGEEEREEGEEEREEGEEEREEGEEATEESPTVFSTCIGTWFPICFSYAACIYPGFHLRGRVAGKAPPPPS